MEQAATQVLTTLRNAGHTALLVGGCVRDRLFGLHPKDLDVATSAIPSEVQSLFPNSNLVGASFGVVIVKMGDHQIEVATFRKDGQYRDGRRPNEVEFAQTAEQDSHRRDFTLNALYAEDVECTRVHDFHGGVEDLKNRVLRTVGSPYDRFAEDYLRMLRAIRFAAKYNLTIEGETLRAIKECGPLVRTMAMERVGGELERLLMCK